MKSCPVWDWRDETVIVTRQHFEMVPYQQTIRLPCPPPGPNYRVPVPLEPSGPPPAGQPYPPAPYPPAPYPPAP